MSLIKIRLDLTSAITFSCRSLGTSKSGPNQSKRDDRWGDDSSGLLRSKKTILILIPHRSSKHHSRFSHIARMASSDSERKFADKKDPVLPQKNPDDPAEVSTHPLAV